MDNEPDDRYPHNFNHVEIRKYVETLIKTNQCDEAIKYLDDARNKYYKYRDQIDIYDLPTRPDKGSLNEAVELDAMPTDVVMNIVEDCIVNHITPEEFNVVRAAEESERNNWKQLITDQAV